MSELIQIDFPTKKPHVSFSEVKMWKECPYRHKLFQIDKIDLNEPSPFLDFGTAVHAGCENIVEGKDLNAKILTEDIKAAWKKYGFDNPEWVKRQPAWYKYHPVDTWCQWAENMWAEVPDFLNEQFPGWEIVKAEEELYEEIQNAPVKFKGFIDLVIKVPKKRGSGFNYWILDWKTAQSYGWRRDKKQDILMTAQLFLYKHFWSLKHNIDKKDIRCGFILLKRGAKPGKICELVQVSAGPKSLEKANKILNSMIKTVSKKFFIKNRNSCQYCPYKNTEHCT
tara:strand:+ start:2727 stop:3569 length:843 start_codon:yes stop_codon:yes gene_type:complete